MTGIIDTKNIISGYHFLQQIYLGTKTIVYRGIREADQKSVIIKLMHSEYPTFPEITQFCNQYTIIKNLDIDGIVKPYSLEKIRNGYALVMEDFGGISLANWQTLKKNEGENFLPLSEFFYIAIEIVSSIEEIHRHRIIHKDIKPDNIIINPTTREVKIIDFSIASILPREIQFLTNINVLEGTLAYISPEQTGRMNRGIDYRTDFYSLGVTLFELLTGQLPFITTDPMELVYCHIAKEAPKVNQINSSIPLILSDLVSKLMAKNAEDRYQSALGLKYDLEICQKQWQETGNIQPFQLGVRDISNRFVIPEKLYGRQHQVETLLAAFERVTRGAAEIVLVAGFSGIGKTAVVNEVHKPILRQRSYFIKGKFDQFQREIPLSGLVQALRDLIGQLLSETDAQIQQWKQKILLALGTQGQVITDVIPDLERIIGKQPPITELSGSASQNRFNLLFQKFIQIFNTKEHPLVIFLDDLQWADITSLKLIQLLMNEKTSSVSIDEIEGKNKGGLLLIGAYRDNEVSEVHPLMLTLQEIKKADITVNRIILEPLEQDNLNCLISDTLHCHAAMTIPLTQLVFTKTKGNPFFATQMLKSLYNEELIKFNFDLGYWEYNLAELQKFTLTDDVVEFMAMQIEKLPKATQEVLKLAACIGNEFDLNTLSIIQEKSAVETASNLWVALNEGLILPQTQTDVYNFFQQGNETSLIIKHQESEEFKISNFQFPRYKFIHDRVQQAAYSLISEDQQKPIHLRIGLLLLNNTPDTERENKIFELVNQFNIALEMITEPNQRDNLAEMNLVAGRKALVSTAYPDAIQYLKTGIELLSNDCWERKYELTLALYETGANAAYLAGDFEKMDQLVEVVLAQAKTLLEKVQVYEIKIQAYGAQNQLLEAISYARKVLKQFGVNFPEQISESDIQQGLEEISALLVDKNIEELKNLPLTTSVSELAIMRIVSSMIPATYIADPLLFPLIILSQVKLSVKSGNSSLSAFCYACYGILLNGILNDIETSDKFGKLALNLVEKSSSQDIKARTLYVVGAFIIHGKLHIQETLPILLESYKTALETGNLDFVGYSAKEICQHSYLIGHELITLEKNIKNYSYILDNFKQVTTLNYCQIYWQAVINFLNYTENPFILSGEVYKEEQLLPLLVEANDISGLHYLYFHKLLLSYYFGNFAEARENAAKTNYYLAGGTGFITVPIFYFYDSLTALAIYPDAKSEQDNLLKQVANNQVKLKNWAYHAPMNYLHKFYLVEAEHHRVLEQHLEAMDDYDRAISLAKEHEYLNEEALACELAAKFYLEWGKEKIAQTYLTESYYCYLRWGALGKVEDLRNRYSQLLVHILHQEQFIPYSPERNTSLVNISTSSDEQTLINLKTGIIESLDLATVIKASQTMSRELDLEQLLSSLMEILMEHAGASKCALILSEGNNLKLTVTAVTLSSTFAPTITNFPSIPLESSENVPIALINYVKRTREIFVVDDATTVTSLVTEQYIIYHQPKSLLCMPMINQGKLIGILYLENNLTTGAFTHDRLEILKLLITQAAISLENSMLYNTNLAEANRRLEEYSHTLEEKVDARTAELNERNQSLQQTLDELQRTQSQLIQSEKMSSLGQMIAGIAHEINNPINFIHGNIDYATEYVEDLINLVNLYQQKYLDPSSISEEKIEEIDINLIMEDLPKLLNSMKVGSLRIRNIVLSLRNFSRLDEAEMKPVNIHDGIDSTLMILQHRIKRNSNRYNIEIIKEYGKLPEVNCYPSQLNQVFMNILSNGIDALEDALTSKKNNHPIIRINTEVIDSKIIRIRIADNGSGMTETVRQKIFDPFFTTKPIGSGTGLGLSISYQIIVDKHKGNLTCESSIGEGTEFIIDIPM